MTAIYNVMIQVSLHCSDIFFIDRTPLVFYSPHPTLFTIGSYPSHCLQFSSKRRHMYPDGTAKTVHRCIPDMLDQFLLAYRSSLDSKARYSKIPFSFLVKGTGFPFAYASRFTRIKPYLPPLSRQTFFCTNFLLVRLLIRASSSCR